ncbi:hypothetical protein CC80DRAFT_325904 [Byssothecium circinans]|uniref:Uncharacterized protein n=1 Tax=Byssothecium circinans TaxID=147558 RepID=A0A6A5U917_9PLEO|nr:hypothetical protein CC80DRAFT_325904 [Byssothecium circinans]
MQEADGSHTFEVPTLVIYNKDTILRRKTVNLNAQENPKIGCRGLAGKLSAHNWDIHRGTIWKYQAGPTGAFSVMRLDRYNRSCYEEAFPEGRPISFRNLEEIINMKAFSSVGFDEDLQKSISKTVGWMVKVKGQLLMLTSALRHVQSIFRNPTMV